MRDVGQYILGIGMLCPIFNLPHIQNEHPHQNETKFKSETNTIM